MVVRESYLAALGWELVELEDGTQRVERSATRVAQSYMQPTNALGLFMNCLNHGLPVANPLPVIAKLSGLANDVICVNTQLGDTAGKTTTNTMDSFRQFAKTNPQLAVSALFQVPTAHPLITQGVAVHQMPDMNAIPPPTDPLYMVPGDDPELDAMLDRILRESGGSMVGQPGLENQFYIENGTEGKEFLFLFNCTLRSALQDSAVSANLPC